MKITLTKTVGTGDAAVSYKVEIVPNDVFLLLSEDDNSRIAEHVNRALDALAKMEKQRRK